MDLNKRFNRLERQATELKARQTSLYNRASNWKTIAYNDITSAYFGEEYAIKGEAVIAKLYELASEELEEAFVLSIVIKDYLDNDLQPIKHIKLCQQRLAKAKIYTENFENEVHKLESDLGINGSEQEG